MADFNVEYFDEVGDEKAARRESLQAQDIDVAMDEVRKRMQPHEKLAHIHEDATDGRRNFRAVGQIN